METISISKCCRVEAVEDYKDNPKDHHDPIPIYICKKCKLECEVEDVCEDCFGTGEVSYDERDNDGNWQRGVGTRKCECQIDDSDFSGATPGDR